MMEEHMDTKKEICHECGNIMRRNKKTKTFSYKGHTIKVKQPGWYCTGCSEILLTSEDIKATEPAFLQLKAEAENLLTPNEIKNIRKNLLKISQRKAGELLGGGPRAFYKYEHGLSLLSRAMSNQLVLLANNPKRLRELEV